MATNYRIQQKQSDGALETLHPETNAKIVKVDGTSAGVQATNVQDAIKEINDNIKSITGGGVVTGVKGDAETEYRLGQVNITKANIGLNNVTNDAQVKRSEMGTANGVATLDEAGKVPSSQLPSYVDDVEEYASLSLFPLTGESGKIYVEIMTNKSYRWSGSQYVEISSSLSLGETSSTAYAGDKGKANAEAISALQQKVNSLPTEDTNTWRPIDIDGDSDVNINDQVNSNKKLILKQGTGIKVTPQETSTSVDAIFSLANSGVTAGTYSVVQVDAYGRVITGAQSIEVGVSGQTTPSANLAVGGIFFQEI